MAKCGLFQNQLFLVRRAGLIPRGDELGLILSVPTPVGDIVTPQFAIDLLTVTERRSTKR